MRWRLLIEEFGLTIEYIKGPKNIVANVLSRLNLVSLPSNVQDLANCYGLDKDDHQAMLSQSPINLSIMNKIKIKLFLLPLKVQSTICLKSFMGTADPHDCYVIKTGLWYQKDCKNELCSGITTLYATQELIELKKLSLNTFIGKIWEMTLHMMYPHVVYVKNKRNSAKRTDYYWKRKLNINHGNNYVSISLVLTKYEQRNVVTKYQN